MIYAKWYHDSIPCMSTSTLVKRLGSLLKAGVDDYKRYQQQLKAGKGELKAVAEYRSLVFKKDVLFDIFPRKTNGEEDRERIKQVEQNWGIKMGKMEELVGRSTTG